MTSNHHAPYDLGYTRATMDGTTSSELARVSESLKAFKHKKKKDVFFSP